jgi:hypothetical protein
MVCSLKRHSAYLADWFGNALYLLDAGITYSPGRVETPPNPASGTSWWIDEIYQVAEHPVSPMISYH